MQGQIGARTRGAATLTAALWIGACSSAEAQWLDYPTPGVPRDADGTPILSAPAPRTSDGKPDLSGMWWSAEMASSCSAEECIPQSGLPLDQINIARSLPDGLPYRPWAAELAENRRARDARDDPHARCLPPNYPRAYTFPQYTKIVQTPNLIVMLHEFNASYRQIFMDGRPLPDDPNPSWNGYSIGRWDDNALVIETIGFRDDSWLDFGGNPLTEEAKVTERLRRPDFGTLEIELTVDDPKAYTQPWTVTLRQALGVDTEMLEEICLDNEQDVRLLEAD